jgi:hypothetical protein
MLVGEISANDRMRLEICRGVKGGEGRTHSDKEKKWKRRKGGLRLSGVK